MDDVDHEHLGFLVHYRVGSHSAEAVHEALAARSEQRVHVVQHVVEREQRIEQLEL